MYVCIYVCIYHICMYVCMLVCMYVCMYYIHTYIHAYIHTYLLLFWSHTNITQSCFVRCGNIDCLYELRSNSYSGPCNIKINNNNNLCKFNRLHRDHIDIQIDRQTEWSRGIILVRIKSREQ